MDKIKEKVFSIKFSQETFQMLDDLKTVTGAGSIAGVVRTAIERFHDKKFPIYKRASGKIGAVMDTLTNEQYCTDILGGKIDKEKLCVWKFGEFNNLTRKVPLSIVKQYVPED